MFLRIPIVTVCAVSLLSLPLAAQVAEAPTPAQARAQAGIVLGDSLQQLNVTIDRLQRALASLTVAKWKAPGDMRQTTQSDIDSMQRDLGGTLPSLVSSAQAKPEDMSPVFAVYRNVDALYDVLLRVSETAQLAGSANDGRMLEDQRATLEGARTQLGAALLQSSQAQDAELTQLRTSASAPSPAATPTKTVVNDGPATHSKSSTKRTHKPSPPPPQ